MLIDGEWVLGSTGKTSEAINPTDGSVLARITERNVADVKKAVAAAKNSFYKTREWRDMVSHARCDLLLNVADAIESEIEEFVSLDTLDQ